MSDFTTVFPEVPDASHHPEIEMPSKKINLGKAGWLGLYRVWLIGLGLSTVLALSDKPTVAPLQMKSDIVSGSQQDPYAQYGGHEVDQIPSPPPGSVQGQPDDKQWQVVSETPIQKKNNIAGDMLGGFETGLIHLQLASTGLDILEATLTKSSKAKIVTFYVGYYSAGLGICIAALFIVMKLNKRDPKALDWIKWYSIAHCGLIILSLLESKGGNGVYVLAVTVVWLAYFHSSERARLTLGSNLFSRERVAA